MKRFIIEQSNEEFYTSHSGLALVGLCINRYSDMARMIKRKMEKKSNVISHTDLLRSYLGLLCLGKSDYEAISSMRDDEYFKNSLAITNIASAETLRQRIDQEAEKYLDIANRCSIALLKNGKAHLSALDTGHIPLDVDVFPMDNSDTKKENIGYTYKGYVGYAPIAAYLGLEGWCLEVELRPGSQHCQEGFPDYMERVLVKARSLTKKKLLVRLDSGHDAIENRVLLRKTKKVSYIIKWNPRREDTAELYKQAFSKGRVMEPRDGKRVAFLTVRKSQKYENENYMFTKVIRVIERKTDRNGQLLLLPEVTVEGWWTNLDLSEEKVISFYQNHGLSEQFHSEFKTDLDLERLPSGKFATNAAVMALGCFAYNILRFIGQLGLLGDRSPVRHPGKRRRLKTVIQELMYLAGRLIRSGHRLRLRFGKHCPAYWAFNHVYEKLLPST